MVLRNNSLPNQGLLRRSRVHSLIDNGLQHPLLVMLAGPGYGKTRAMSAYLLESGENALWLRLTALDNLTSHFWNHVTQTFKPEYPELSQCLSLLGFPDTLSSFDAFVQMLVEQCAEQKRLIWVFDDFGAINNEQIKTFIRMLVDMELEQFSIVLISNELGSTESIAFLSNKRFLILAKDLRFTRSEMAELYSMYNVPLGSDALNDIERHTEGWALALHLLVQRQNNASATRLIDEITISHMFEERFFSNFSKQQQRLLAKLALLSSFSKELAIDLYDGNPVDLQKLANHAFITQEPVTGRLFLHHLYLAFLRKKRYLLTEKDKQQTWKASAEHYAATGEALEAMTCYRNCGDHANMLKMMSRFAEKLWRFIEKDAAFLLRHLDLLTPQEVYEYPVADYLRAHIYASILEVEKAESLLLNLEKRLLERNRAEESAFLGEIYVALGFIHMMRNQEDYGEFFQRAVRYLPNGSNFYSNNTLSIENNNCFALADNLPGARERMELAAYNATPWINKVLHGCMSGMEHIISAESAFLICDFEKARQQAYQGIYKAEANAQHDYAVNGYFVLARIGWLLGDLAETDKQIKNIVEYTARYRIAVLEEIRDTILCWYYLRFEDVSRVPKNIMTLDYSKRSLLAYGRTQIAYAAYLLAKGEYAQMVGMLEHPRGLFLGDGIWHDRISLFILLAIGYYLLGNQDAALKNLWTAYDMCHHNKLAALFIEAGSYLLPLIDLAGQQHKYEFSQQWLDSIYGQIRKFAKRADMACAEYRKRHAPKPAKSSPLSKREREVLQALAKGLTREEIALKQYISVHTVKAAIRSVYTKLNASNRAEAVSIAIAHQYIEGYMTK